jgi:bla regulator protein BlaR1
MMLKSLAGFAAASAPIFANHLWQSTLFAVAVGAVTLAFRRNQARVRFALWLAASIKFLIPFSLLIGLGSHMARPHAVSAAPAGLYLAIDQFSHPFAGPAASAVPRVHRAMNLAALLPAALVGLWLCGFFAVLALWCLRWVRLSMAMRRTTALAEGRELDALRRLEQLAGLRRPIPLLVSPDSMEPGVFGIFRPVLLWPHGISGQLEDAHLEAILAHEVGHVRRRDNLSAALHMLVEAVFWFHPLVWWLGARLIDERERACDEEVLGLGNQPEVYAESILKACKFCVESPLPCVSGVAGSDLKKRIVRIMNGHPGIRLSLAGKVALAIIGLAAVSAPIAVGLFNAAPVRAQEPQSAADPAVAFDEASIKASNPGDKESRILTQPGSFVMTSVTLKTVIALAYGVQAYQLAGLPDWVNTEKFDIEAHWKESPGVAPALVANPPSGDLQFVATGSSNSTVAPPPPPPLPPGAAAIHQRPFQLQIMLQKLLADRFNLRLSHESRDLPVYNLVVADTGSKLTPTPSSPPPPVAPSGKSMITVRAGMQSGNHELMFTNTSPAVFADLLSQQLGRKVLDKTGLTGQFDITLQWGNGESEPEQISAALEDQLGLKIEADQAPVDVLVIDQVERPAADLLQSAVRTAAQ